VTHTDTVKAFEVKRSLQGVLGCQDLGWMIGGEESLNWRQRSGNAAGPIICIGSAEKSMTFTRRNRRGIFGNASVRPEARVPSLARLNKHLQQDWTSKRLEGVLKSSAPEDTEMIASMAATDSDPKPKSLRW